MRGTQAGSALASYRDTVTEQIKAGEPFGDIEEAIDEVADLTTDQKAALWLFAFRCDRDSTNATRVLTWPRPISGAAAR